MMPSSKINKRLILAVFAETGLGKTHIGLTALGNQPGEKRIAVLDFGNSTTHFDGRVDVPEFDVAHIDPAQDPEAQVLAQVSDIKKNIARYGLFLADDFGKAWSALCDLHPTRDGKPVGFGDWKDIRPKHRRMFNAILSVPLDIILTFREADDYEMKGSRPERVGAKLAGESDTSYEPDLILHLQEDDKGRYGDVTKADRHGVYRVGQRIDAPTFQNIKAGIVGGDKTPAPPKASDEQKAAFKALIGWGKRTDALGQDAHDRALAWADTATVYEMAKKITSWQGRRAEADSKVSEDAGEPKDGPTETTDDPAEDAFVAEHVAKCLEKDIAAGRSLDDMAGAMLKHPSLNGQKSRLLQAWQDAGGSAELQKSILLEARRLILK